MMDHVLHRQVIHSALTAPLTHVEEVESEAVLPVGGVVGGGSEVLNEGAEHVWVVVRHAPSGGDRHTSAAGGGLTVTGHGG